VGLAAPGSSISSCLGRGYRPATHQLPPSYLCFMRLCLLTIPFTYTALLLSALGCTKKDDPNATPSNTGSYKLDGRATIFKAQCFLYLGRDTANRPTNTLVIRLTESSQAPNETANVVFSKYESEPASAYILRSVDIIQASPPSPVPTTRPYQDARQFTISPTGSGGFSGTFTAHSDSSTYSGRPSSAVTDGVFTDVHL
jgi:hypothetical protein